MTTLFRAACVAAPALVAACVSSCGVLAHPVSNDGADAGNPIGANPGTAILTISASRESLGVGDTASIVGTISGRTLENTGGFITTSSDPSVLFVAGTTMFARSVGTATINATYDGYQATPSISITVHPAADGTSASIVVQNTDPPAFAPANVYVKAGAWVSFSTGTTHDVTFDILAGAPQDIPTGSRTASRMFALPGSFTYRCTAHGETGVVNVTP